MPVTRAGVMKSVVVEADHDVERGSSLQIDLEIDPGRITEQEAEADAICARGRGREGERENGGQESSHAAMVDPPAHTCEVRRTRQSFHKEVHHGTPTGSR